jgi:hypothetical protein
MSHNKKWMRKTFHAPKAALAARFLRIGCPAGTVYNSPTRKPPPWLAAF